MVKKSLSEMRHEVIENTIKLENFLDELIMLSFDMEIDLNQDYRRYKEITAIFEKHFLAKTPISRKFEVIKEIIKDNRRKELPSDFGSNIKEFIEIRNVFAHQLVPIMEEDMSRLKKRMMQEDRESLRKKYKRHCILYNKLFEFIFGVFYKKINET